MRGANRNDGLAYDFAVVPEPDGWDRLLGRGPLRVLWPRPETA